VNKKVLKSSGGPFLSLFEATSCDQYFAKFACESAKVCKITFSLLNNFLIIGFGAKYFCQGNGSHTQ
jgi:hypothetical protein